MPPSRPRAAAPRTLLYGATGFSGRLIAEAARARGLPLIVAARADEPLRALADRLGCPARAFTLDDPRRVDAALADVDVVLNAAGPFAATAGRLFDACLRTRTDYLDITGELPVFAALARRDAEASARGVMAMPGVGFVVVPSDCLAAHVARRLPDARHLVLAVSRTDTVSPGSLRTVLASWSGTATLRRGGALVQIPTGTHERRIDYGRGPSRSTAVDWGDLITAHRTTGIPDIEVLLEVSPAERAMFRLSRHVGPLVSASAAAPWLQRATAILPEPTAGQRAPGERLAVAEARDGRGRRARARLRTPDAYAFTASSAAAVIDRVLRGERAAGFQSPARLLGADFVLSLAGVVRDDLPA